MDRVRNTLSSLRGQLWLIPAMFTAAAGAAAAILMQYRPFGIGGDHPLPWWLYSGQAGTARELLSSLLSGMMTMTSLVISVTFVILTLAANQLGPRLIVIFITDRQIQSVLGLFIGTIFYLIIVLRTLDDSADPSEIPHVAVTMGTLLTVFCLLALLFYIHKIARSINANDVIDSVFRETRRSLHTVLPEAREAHSSTDALSRNKTWHPIALGSTGYIQVVDYERLLAIAREENMVIEVVGRAGDHVLKRSTHVTVSTQPSETQRKAIISSFTIGTDRSPAQDPEYGVRQLVEIALRALSPGLNDTFTVLVVLDRLAAVCEETFAHDGLPVRLKDDQGVERVLAHRIDTASLIDAAFRPIRLAAFDNIFVLEHIARVIGSLDCSITHPSQHIALVHQLRGVEETAKNCRIPSSDREAAIAEIRKALQALANRRIGG